MFTIAIMERITGITTVVAYFAIITITALSLYVLSSGIYNVYFHPAKHIPGPRLWAANHLFKDLACANGDIDNKLCELHKKYGKAVRISPDEVSFIDERAWRDIYSHPNYMAKWPRFAFIHNKPDTPADIINSTHEDHARIRRQLSHAFSEKALREQEGLITKYIDLLLLKLRDAAESQQPVNLVKWYNWTTFDVISELSFGASFECLKNGAYHAWVSSVFNNIRAFNAIRCFATYPGAKFIIGLFASKDMRKSRDVHKNYSRDTVLSRLAEGTQEQRRDFISYTLKHKDEGGMTKGEIIRTASTLIMAGSETTATLLSGVTYFLGITPHALEKLTKEVRAAFKSEDEINFTSAPQKLPYMLNCLDEALRLYPPAPFLSQRLTPPGMTMVAGVPVPGGMGIGVARLAAARNSEYFYQADKFWPERWQEAASTDPKSPFFNDARNSFQSFLVGPGACLGRNLAYNEMRTILARLVWNFDLELQRESAQWTKDQKTYVVWDKPDLMVKLNPRKN